MQRTLMLSACENCTGGFLGPAQSGQECAPPVAAGPPLSRPSSTRPCVRVTRKASLYAVVRGWELWVLCGVKAAMVVVSCQPGTVVAGGLLGKWGQASVYLCTH